MWVYNLPDVCRREGAGHVRLLDAGTGRRLAVERHQGLPHRLRKGHGAADTEDFSEFLLNGFPIRICNRKQQLFNKMRWLKTILYLSLFSLGSTQRARKPVAKVTDPYPKQTSFVRVFDNKFVTDDCKEYFFTGFNAWELIESAIGFPKVLPDDLSFLGDKNLLEYILDICVQTGLNVVRLFGHGTTSDISTQRYCCPGEYKEEVLQGLDYILDQAAQRDLKVILTFGDNWRSDFPDTVMYYVNNSDTATTQDDFWLDPTTKQMYKNHIAFMTSRVNSFNNRTYRDDPTIFAWNVINEPRCRSEECKRGNLLSEWIHEMAGFIKSVDPNHMVTVGEEGFYKPGCEQEYNPGTWASNNGQDSLLDHSSEHIDFVATHVWPDNWGRVDEEFLLNWLKAKKQDADILQKPLVIEEFGKATESMTDADEIANVRDPVYSTVYQHIEESFNENGYLRGGLFWTFNYGQPHEWSFGYGIRLGDSTWDYIQAHARLIAIKALAATPVEGCVPGRGAISTFTTERPEFFAQENPATCCDEDCGAMYGWIQGDIVSTTVTGSLAECCATCIEDAGCNGYNWCSCRGGCSGYDYQTCILKAVPFPQLPISSINEEDLKFLGGIPNVNYVPFTQCQFDYPCADPPYTCNARQFQRTIQCPTEDCNVFRGNLQGKTVVPDVAADTGLAVYTAAQCCEACKNTEGCNTWVYCNDPSGCDGYQPKLCALKYIDFEANPELTSKADDIFQVWLSGFLYDGELYEPETKSSRLN
eukprot:TRINITY_DN3080_c0_g1_i14.p1 TRINITY_DN3080_c0_g1~~TRINITY_DN3080_c0_g1_i14.p1  ORF type:complete len:758 (-),score=74.95 TRINITY_DN3080_c0_g1_i14:662-2935(-)